MYVDVNLSILNVKSIRIMRSFVTFINSMFNCQLRLNGQRTREIPSLIKVQGRVHKIILQRYSP